MTQSLVQGIIDALSGSVGKEAIVFIISMIPILELRGALLVAGPVSYTHLDVYKRQVFDWRAYEAENFKTAEDL